MTDQSRIAPLGTTPKIAAAGQALGLAIAAAAKHPPRCACGRKPVRVETKVEIIGSTVTVDLVLRCASCA